MFEIDQYERQRHGEPLPRPALSYKCVAPEEVAAASLLVWGEHCIECAAPACYSTCDLYVRRPDGRCRRFAYGAARNFDFPSFRGYGVEVAFKKWGKLEARGNTLLVSARTVPTIDSATAIGLRAAGLVGLVMSRMLRKPRWSFLNHAVHEHVARKVHRALGRRVTPDVFLVEVYNPGTQVVNLQLIVAADGRRQQGLQSIVPTFRAKLALPPGYSRHEVDYRLIKPIANCEAGFDLSLTPEGDDEVKLVFLAADFVRFHRGARERNSRGKDVKCVVWDLDNTLWDGVLLENPDVQLRPGVYQILRYLDDRGILLSIASKNDYGPAWKRLEELGIAHLFLHPQINWMPKSENVKRVAQLLDIGLDTLAFIDDNPFELDEVRQGSPDVFCIHDLDEITVNPRMQGSTTADARSRRLFYQHSIVREQEESRFGANYLEFLRACSIVLEIASYTPDDLDRVAELVQRTNQLNFSGRKYSRSVLYEILDNSELDKFVLRCSDRYGSYGTIGFSIVRAAHGALTVEDFMVSCRVQGKFLEQAFFDHLTQHHNPEAVQRLNVAFRKTERNTPAQKVLETIGFRHSETGMSIALDASLACDFIDVRCSYSHGFKAQPSVRSNTGS